MRLNRKSILGGTVALAAALAASGAWAQALQDGSFQSCVGSGCTLANGYAQLNAGTAQLPGWNISNATEAQLLTGAASSLQPEGSDPFFVALGSASHGTLSQTFSTLAGHTYDVTFWVASVPVGAQNNPTKTGTVTNGFSTDPFSVGVPGDGGNPWEEVNYQFTAGPGSTTTLTFANTTTVQNSSDSANPDGQDKSPLYRLGLDNVSVSAVPEPAAWALMIVGFGLVGGGLRRRTAALATA